MDRNETGARLRALRGERSREETARALHISPAALEAYETGARVPRDEVKVALARYYRSSVADLFFDKNATNRDETAPATLVCDICCESISPDACFYELPDGLTVCDDLGCLSLWARHYRHFASRG